MPPPPEIADHAQALEASKQERAPESKLSNSSDPDQLVLVVRDLSGFFIDCGCTGEAKGGLARLKALSQGFSSSPVFLATGGVFAMDSSRLAHGKREAYEAQMRKSVPFLAEAWRELRAAKHLQGHNDSSFDQDLRTEQGVPSQAEFKLRGVRVAIRDGQIRAATTSKRLFTTDLPTARGREALLIALWVGDSAEGEVLFRQDLSVLLLPSVRKRQSTLFDQASEGLREALKESSAVLSYAKIAVTGSLSSDDQIMAILRQAVTDSGKPIDANLALTKLGSASQSVEEQCGSCHKAAFTSWQASRHSRALLSLVSYSEQSDAGACYTCHTEQGSPHSGPQAVTCRSCHSSNHTGDEPLLPSWERVCLQCHTSDADPNEHFRAQLNAICKGRSSPEIARPSHGAQAGCPLTKENKGEKRHGEDE